MRGDPKVLALLNDILTSELTAINQYWLHARLCDNWGYERLWHKIRQESLDEMKHADALVERILYLEGHPNLQKLGKLNIGQNVPEVLKSDLAIEQEAIPRFNEGIELARAQGDNGTRELLETMLVSEEKHANWLEEQLTLIAQVGEQNYLAQQIKKGD